MDKNCDDQLRGSAKTRALLLTWCKLQYHNSRVAGAPSMEAVRRADREHPSGTGLFAGVARSSFLYEGGHALLSVSRGDHLS